MEIKIPYYQDLTRVSNSNIGWFLQKGPAYLHKMLTDPLPEEKSSALERGTMIHEYTLQPKEFQKDYVVWDKPKPSSPQQEEFCHALAESLEIEPNKAVLDAYKKAYSTVSKSEDKMLSEGLKIASTLKDYIDFLKANDGRIMISPWDVKMLEKIKQNIQSHKLAREIIYQGMSPQYSGGTFYEDNYISYEGELDHGTKILKKWYHEFHINWEYPVIYDIDIGQHETERSTYTIKCKSLLDGLTLDFKEKIATIYDLKTTQKLWHFEDSIDQYDYLRQLAYYMMAVKWYLKNECDEDPDKWEYRFYIIGIDTTGFNEIRVFEVEQFMVESRLLLIHKAITDIGWHQMNDKWDHSREYYEGDGSETLNL